MLGFRVLGTLQTTANRTENKKDSEMPFIRGSIVVEPSSMKQSHLKRVWG